jgi:hypothetical protein
MNRQGWSALTLLILLAQASLGLGDDESAESRGSRKKVLVELYSSQGNSSCLPASDLLGRLARLGYGPDRVIALNFHVDSRNDPWVDPYSDPAADRRQRYYGDIFRRDLSFTPLMLVNGRFPLIGSNRTAALDALESTVGENALVTLELTLTGSRSLGSLSARVAARSPVVNGRELIVGLALVDDHVTTKVFAGENTGRTLVEHQVIRRIAERSIKLEGARPQTVPVPTAWFEGLDSSSLRFTAFVQDRLTGEVYQAESIPCPAPMVAPQLAAKPVRSRPKPRASDVKSFILLPSWLEDPPTCPECGIPYSTEFLNSHLPQFSLKNPANFPGIPLPKC